MWFEVLKDSACSRSGQITILCRLVNVCQLLWSATLYAVHCHTCKMSARWCAVKWQHSADEALCCAVPNCINLLYVVLGVC